MKLRPVIILEWDRTQKEDGRYLKKEVGTGLFHEWGANFEEFDNGAGNYSIAIVEKSNGEVLSLPIELIKFQEKK